MDPDLGPAHPAEETFGLVGAGAVPGIGFLVVDPGHDVAGMQFVEGGSLIGMDHAAARDLAPDEGRSRLRVRPKSPTRGGVPPSEGASPLAEPIVACAKARQAPPVGSRASFVRPRAALHRYQRSTASVTLRVCFRQ